MDKTNGINIIEWTAYSPDLRIFGFSFLGELIWRAKSMEKLKLAIL